ncbi:MAG: sodium:solute symporter [Cyclobacteriaceae bacterium]|nr:sodium:solute symporter [Cyclobacteriaceae bacterium]MCH8515349.1 sodium:solute symporter [Cyclobacteriaceae bacterium]
MLTTLAFVSIQQATAVLLLVYMAAVLLLVIRGYRQTKSMDDYAVGSVHFSPSFVGLSLAASMTSAATFIINPGLIGTYGIAGFISYGLALPIAAVFSLVLLTKGFRKYGSKVAALTLAQWMGKRYESPRFALFFAFLSLLLLAFVVLICVGITQVLAKGLGLEPLWILIGVISFVFGYMMFGGANSMVYTNAIQAISMLIVAVILIASGYQHFEAGIQGFVDKLRAIDPLLVSATNPASPIFRDFFEIIFCQVIVGIAVVCQPHILTKSLLLKKEEDVNQYLTVGAIVQFLFFLVVIAGLYARLVFPDMQQNGVPIAPDELISTYVVTYFPVALGILIIFGLMSAGMSTLEGLIQSLSTTITEDIVKKVAPESFREKLKNHAFAMAFNRWVIVALGFAAFALSYEQLIRPNVSVAIFAQNGVYAYFSCAFVPVLFGMFHTDSDRRAVFAAAVTALIVHFGIYYGGIGPYMQESVRNPAIPTAMAILSATAVGYALYFLLPRTKKVTP